MKNVDAAISDMFALAITHETSTSPKERQVVKMKAGKVRRFLKSENDACKQDRTGVKDSN